MRSNPASALALSIDPDALRPLVEQVVEATLARLEQARDTIPERLAFSESEAARLIGLAPHQLRDERLRGRIAASQLVGKRVFYLRADLTTYLLRSRVNDPARESA